MKLKWVAIPFLLCMLQACSREGENQKETINEVPVVKLSPRDTVVHTDYVTEIQAIKNVEIRSRIHGFIEKMLVDEGQMVQKGQLLFQLGDKEFAIALNKANANLGSAESAAKIARVELERIKTLVQKKVISSSELSLGEAKVAEADSHIKSAKAMIEEAKQKLSYTQIRAPFSGTIDRLPLKTGSLVDEGTLLTTVSDTREMYAYFDISENEYLQFARKAKDNLGKNKEVTLLLADGETYPLKGKIQTHESAFSENMGSIAFRALFTNPKGILKHGSSGKVQLTSQLSGSILIPQKSVFEIQDKHYVFVMGKDNLVKMKSFTPTMSLSGFYVAGEGLSSGETIVYEGVQNIKDGTVIKPVYQKQSELLARN